MPAKVVRASEGLMLALSVIQGKHRDRSMIKAVTSAARSGIARSSISERRDRRLVPVSPTLASALCGGHTSAQFGAPRRYQSGARANRASTATPKIAGNLPGVRSGTRDLGGLAYHGHQPRPPVALG